MEDSFKTEFISPEKIIFSDNNSMTTLPAYEGDMSILKDHIPLITFLRPGIVRVNQNNKNVEEFFVQDGTVEFFKNILVILSASAVNLKELSKDFVNNLNNETKEKLSKENITDHDRYILNHKINVLKDIGV